MGRSLNKVELIGNLTRDPELRYIPQGTAVCTFGIATNRQWTTEAGEKKESVEFHNIVAWNKLAELCSQLLAKGRRIYVEGRLQTRKWTGQDNVERRTTEIIINDMIILDSRGGEASQGVSESEFDIPEDLGLSDSQGDGAVTSSPTVTKSPKATTASDDTQTTSPKSSKKTNDTTKDATDEEDIPF